ncbi:MAG: hypothetical protein V4637_08225 [Pseudomonadota bacterium]
MKHAVYALLLAVGLTGSAAGGAANAADPFLLAQAQKGRQGAGNERGERTERERERGYRSDRSEERRERMTDEQRRALHRDLDKANRELYGRPPQR